MVSPSTGAPRHAAFFDVDRTLLRGSSMLALARPLRRAGLISTRVTLRALARQLLFGARGMSDPALQSAVASLSEVIRGVDAAAVRRVADRAMGALVLPRVYDEAFQLMEWHRQRGDLIFLVSASPHELIDALQRILDADGVVASDVEVKHGKYTGRILRLNHGDAKGAAVEEFAHAYNLDLTESYAYGDSLGDQAMLERVGHPVAVNPDSRLSALAEERGWPQRHFRHRHPRPLARDGRRRPSTPRRGPAADRARH
ncbi:MAG: HAD family hydrolase [Candidatus Dormibacteria bacterium]